MKRLLFAAALWFAWLGAASAQTAAPAETTWLGEFRIGGKASAIILHDRSGTPGAASAIDVPATGARDMPLSSFSMASTRSQFVLQAGPDQYSFDGAVSGAGIAGKVTQGQQTGDFTLVPLAQTDVAFNRKLAGSYQVGPGHVIDIGPMSEIGGQLVFLDQKTLRQGPLYPLSAAQLVSGPTLGIPYPFAIHVDVVKDGQGAISALRWTESGRTVSAKKIAPHRTEDVTVVNGDITLKGTLLVPLSKGPHPAIVFAHGSGDALRDVGMWNTFFVRQGMAVLSLDKRGAGASSGDWHTASMDDIAGDWLAVVAMLKDRADIDAKRIGVHASSQGGWTAPIMAVRSKDVAYLIVRAGSADTVADTMAHEVAWSVREAGLSEVDAQATHAASLRMFKLAGAAWPAFSAAAVSYQAKPWAQHAWPLHMSEKGWGRAWNALNAPYDPAATLAKVKVPVLWFLGDLDHNVPSASTAKLLQAAKKVSGNQDFTVVRMPNAGHSFLESSTGNNAEFVRMTHMAAGYWDTMSAWLARRGLSKP